MFPPLHFKLILFWFIPNTYFALNSAFFSYFKPCDWYQTNFKLKMDTFFNGEREREREREKERFTFTCVYLWLVAFSFFSPRFSLSLSLSLSLFRFSRLILASPLSPAFELCRADFENRSFYSHTHTWPQFFRLLFLPLASFYCGESTYIV